MPYIESDNSTLFYEAQGSGPLIVFAHGAGGNTLSWWQQVPHFLKHYRVLVFDHRGFGRSVCDPNFMGLDFCVQDLKVILDDEKADQAILVCQSMGGFTGLPFTLKFPERVKALVLCGTSGGVVTDDIIAARKKSMARLKNNPGLNPAMALDFPNREPALAHLYYQIHSLNNPDLVNIARTGLAKATVKPEDLNGRKTPTLIIAGTEDLLFPMEAMESVAASIPGAVIRWFRKAGHSIYFEQADLFNRVLSEFLENLQ